MHRVVPAADMNSHRYSIAYFLRPENGLRFEDPEGKEITAKEWHDKKYRTFADSHEEQNRHSVLMGGMASLTEIAL